MVDESLYPIIRECKSAKDVWTKLSNSYEDKGLSRRLGLLRKPFHTNMADFESMEDYLNEILSLTQKLDAIGAGIEDEFIGVIMLNGLSEDYNPLIMTIENSGAAITSDYIRSILIKQDTKRMEKMKENVLLTNTKGSNKGRCSICQKKGHNASKCWKRNQSSKAEPNSQKQHNRKQKASEKSTVLISALSASAVTDNDWVVDSGASRHMTMREDWLDKHSRSSNTEILTANKNMLVSKSSGDVILKPSEANSQSEVIIKNVLHVPGIAANLLSVNELVEKKYVVVFSRNGCYGYKEDRCKVTGTTSFEGYRENGVFKLNKEGQEIQHSQTIQALNSTADQLDSHRLWHRRLGHLCRRSMNLLHNRLATGLKWQGSNDDPCEACVKGKQAKLKFVSSTSRAQKKLELVHSDVCGPMPKPSWGGAYYILTLTDDFTRKTFTYLLRNKSEVTERFKEFMAWVEKQTGEKVKVLRTDNGKEYVNRQLENFLRENGIIHQTTVTYTPEQNGVAERLNRTIVEKARSMLQDSNLSERYWGEAVSTATYLKNRSPTMAVPNMTPEEAWTGKKPDLGHLKVFGCKALALLPPQKRRKWDSKSKEYIFMGYPENVKGYRLLNPKNPKEVIIARNVTFFENEPFNRDCQEDSPEVKQAEYGESIIRVQQPTSSSLEPMTVNEHSEEEQPLVADTISERTQQPEESQESQSQSPGGKQQTEGIQLQRPGAELDIDTDHGDNTIGETI